MTEEQAVLRSNPPPLRIHHLLLWMTVSMLLIAGCISFDRTMRNGPAIENKIVIGSLVVGAIAIAGALTFTFLGIYWSDRGYPFPVGPGEWLLWTLAHVSMALAVAFVGIFVVFSIVSHSLTFYYVVVGPLLFFYWMRSNFLGITRYSDTGEWRLVFASLMLTTIAAPLVEFGLPMVLFFGCLLTAVRDDWRCNVTRGWLHWLGVTLAFAVACALIGTFDVPRFFR